MRRVLMARSLVLSCLFLAVSCGSPVAPTSSATLDQFVQALRQRGLSASLAGEISPENNGFFSVPAHTIRVNAGQVNAFVYQDAEAAGAEAALISQDGQPGPTGRVTWVSTPHFYRHGALIVLYVGCAAEIVEGLQATLGLPIAVGRTPCDIGK